MEALRAARIVTGERSGAGGRVIGLVGPTAGLAGEGWAGRSSSGQQRIGGQQGRVCKCEREGRA